MRGNHCMLFLAVLPYTLNASNRSLEVICPLQVTVNSCEPLGHPNKWGTTNLVPAAYLLHLEALQQTPSRYVPQIATACYHTKKQRLKELSSKGCRFTQSQRSENLQTPGCLTKRQPGCLKAFRPKANPPQKKTVETSDITPTNGPFSGNWGFITPIYGRLRNPTCTTAWILNLPWMKPEMLVDPCSVRADAAQSSAATTSALANSQVSFALHSRELDGLSSQT